MEIEFRSVHSSVPVIIYFATVFIYFFLQYSVRETRGYEPSRTDLTGVFAAIHFGWVITTFEAHNT